MRPRSVTVIAAFAALCSSGCDVGSADRHAAFERSAERTRTALIKAGDPDSLEAAAFFGRAWGDQPPESLALISRAAAAAPERPDIAWLRLELCVRVKTCDPKPIEVSLRALDPGNGAAWTGSLERMDELGDMTATLEVIDSIAGADHFYTYWNPTIVHVAHAVMRTDTMGPSAALIATIGVGAAQPMPYQPFMRACREEPLGQPQAVTTCRRLAAVLRRSDETLTEMLGVTIAQRVWPKDSPEYCEAAAAHRRLRYRLDMESEVAERYPEDDAHAQRYLALLADHPTEQEVVDTEIRSAGLNPDPAPTRSGLPPAPQ